MDSVNILEVARGAIGEKLSYELAAVVKNINDPNTKADAVRKLSITVSLKPDSERKNISMSTQVKSTLVPTNNIETSLWLTEDNGNPALVEMTPQIPGQMNMDGGEQEQPKIITIAKAV